jgi:hypothetical protein
MGEWLPYDGIYSVCATSIAELCFELHKAIMLHPLDKRWIDMSTVGVDISRRDPAAGLWSRPSNTSDIVDGEILRVHQLRMVFPPSLLFKVGMADMIEPVIEGGVTETKWPIASFGLSFSLVRNRELENWLVINPASGALSGEPRETFGREKVQVLVSQFGATAAFPVMIGAVRLSRSNWDLPDVGSVVQHPSRGKGVVRTVDFTDGGGKPFLVDFGGGETHQYSAGSVRKMKVLLTDARLPPPDWDFSPLVRGALEPLQR